MDGSRAAHVDLLRYWHAIEMFSPQDVPSLSHTVKDLRDEGPLPWQAGARYFPSERLGRDKVWRYTLFLGLYTQDRVDAILERWGRPTPLAYRDGRPGTTAVAALQVTDQGQLVAGSFVVSSCAWACGRCLQKPPTPDNLIGLDHIQAQSEARLQNLLRLDDDNDSSDPVSRKVLDKTLGRLTNDLGIEACLGPVGVRIEVGQVPKKAAAETDTDFLNSFFLDDLATVARQASTGYVGPTLASYLAPPIDAGRTDILRDPHALRRGLAPDLVPPARWPAEADRALVTHQQFAANHALASLTDGSGIVAVNGPPGTGKTTLLRDLVAGIVVERARRLADLDKARDAFVAIDHYSTERRGRKAVHLWHPGLTGHEIVVASSNNGAVDNVVNEIPAVGAVAEEWADQTDHFADIATDLLMADAEAPAEGTSEGIVAREAWALLAARLGNRKNRSTFVDMFWFEPKENESPRRAEGLLPILKAWTAEPPAEPWGAAVSRFRQASDRVERGCRDRQQTFLALEHREAATREVDEATSELSDAHREAHTATSMLEAEERLLTRATVNRDGARAREDEIEARRPPFWRPWTRRRWRESLAESHRRRGDAEDVLIRALERYDHAVWVADETSARDAAAESRVARARAVEQANQAAVTAARQRWPRYIPSDVGPEAQQSPWLDEEWNADRAALFLAALRLHKDFLRHAAQPMLDNLNLAVDVVKGTAPPDLPAALRLAAWQSLFLTVPVVSTTFASFGRLFSGVGEQGLGWLFVDEAGQSSPQVAVGAPSRCRRAVVVGDPLQLEPVDSLSWPSREALREQHRVPPDSPTRPASVQTRADERSAFGTRIAETWVGSPLVVHRRCDEPVFGLVNTIAYDHSMVHGVGPRGEFRMPDGRAAPPSQWIAIETGAAETDGHWVLAEGRELARYLRAFRAYDQDMKQIMLLGAFREVAKQLRELAEEFACGASGTVHTSQGKEADIVFLVLGGDPTRPGALDWAAERPNLLNVAASRSRRRLYVIGDRERWGRLRYFSSLTSRLSHDSPPEGGGSENES